MTKDRQEGLQFFRLGQSVDRFEHIDDEGVAQMENRLLAKPEFTDSRMIGRLAAHAERKDVAREAGIVTVLQDALDLIDD